jgi:hypothetical protein
VVVTMVVLMVMVVLVVVVIVFVFVCHSAASLEIQSRGGNRSRIHPASSGSRRYERPPTLT